MSPLALLFTFVHFATPANAEYRAYRLAITDTVTKATRSLVTTLDDRQYIGYYPLRQNETLAIAETWMCWGRHDHFTPVCANPSARTDGDVRAPASKR